MLSNEVALSILVLMYVANLVKVVVLNFQLFCFYCKDTSVTFKLSVTRFEQLSFYCKDTSTFKKSPRVWLQSMMQSMTSYKVVYISDMFMFISDKSMMQKQSMMMQSMTSYKVVYISNMFMFISDKRFLHDFHIQKRRKQIDISIIYLHFITQYFFLRSFKHSTN